jgi:hypothetical protein
VGKRLTVVAGLLAVALLAPPLARADHVQVDCEGFAPRDTGCSGTLVVEERGRIIIGHGFGPFVKRVTVSVTSDTATIEDTCTDLWLAFGSCETTNSTGEFEPGQVATVRVSATGVGWWHASVTSI